LGEAGLPLFSNPLNSVHDIRDKRENGNDAVFCLVLRGSAGSLL
jgi:hypothetical protein